MKHSINQKALYFVLLAFLIISCKNDKKSSDTNAIAKDTITTASGLKYFYTVKGTGRKIESGSKISAILSLKVNDSVIWTTYSSKDSIFSNIAGTGEVIKGYDEMSLLLREGDDVVAILPSELAYGERGSGEVIPPNSTLIYDQFKITYVGEPRLVLSDTLFSALKNGGIDMMKKTYNQITKTKDSINYHGGLDQLNALWRKLSREKMFSEAKDAFLFINKEYKNTTFDFYVINSLDNQGKLKDAIAKIDLVLKGKLSSDQKEYFVKYKQDLVNKLDKK